MSVSKAGNRDSQDSKEHYLTEESYHQMLFLFSCFHDYFVCSDLSLWFISSTFTLLWVKMYASTLKSFLVIYSVNLQLWCLERLKYFPMYFRREKR